MVGFGASLALLVAVLVARMTCQQIQRRIMNGIETKVKNLPWVVAFCREDFSVFGSGSIVSEKWVLTAGHLWDVPKKRSESHSTILK
jgi:secreted trypsin-like serine protease